MADRISKKQRSALMAKIYHISKMEVSARRHATGIVGCRLHHQPDGLIGKPDYANKKRKVVVFIDGCFWHMCPKHCKVPKSNVEFWEKKLKRNVERRAEVKEKLFSKGFSVYEIWEHDVTRVHKKDIGPAAMY